MFKRKHLVYLIIGTIISIIQVFIKNTKITTFVALISLFFYEKYIYNTANDVREITLGEYIKFFLKRLFLVIVVLFVVLAIMSHMISHRIDPLTTIFINTIILLLVLSLNNAIAVHYMQKAEFSLAVNRKVILIFIIVPILNSFIVYFIDWMKFLGPVFDFFAILISHKIYEDLERS